MSDAFLEPVIEKIKTHFLDFDIARIRRAYEYARDAHAGQRRFSGEPYITHPVAVMDLLLDYQPDEDMVVAALLHDVSEDTERTLGDIEKEFGTGVRNLVYGLEKLSKVRSRLEEPEIENLRKMFITMANDLRSIVIKLCDRLHNMSTLEYVKPHKQERIARETLHVYVPIAARLGIYRLKSQLEDYCFSFLNPEEQEHIAEQLQKYTSRSTPVIDEMKRSLQKHLAMCGIEQVTVTARLKSYHSIYTKLKRKGKTMVDDLYDVFALRVILPDQMRAGAEYTGHLYSVLGAIHSQWSPLPHRFKDYVAVPKPNGYRSLHTTVMGLGPKSRNLPTEVQIRTQSMHDQAEKGIASHWLYDHTKGGSAGMDLDTVKKQIGVDWVNALSAYQDEVSNNQEFMSGLQTDFFNKRIFVFTPAGDVKDLPAGATPVDFAYAVHTDVGNRCTMAKMNGQIVPLDSDLTNGAVVEIITREGAEPNQYWLSFVKTSSARSKIKHWFKMHEDPQKMLREGKEILNKHLERLSKPLLDGDLLALKEYNGKRLPMVEREELLRDLGRGVILPTQVVKGLFTESELLRSKSIAKRLRVKRTTRKKAAKKVDLRKQIEVDGLDLPLKLANCCTPRKGDLISGFVTRGQGITVHRQNCKVLLNHVNHTTQDRSIDVNWRTDGTPIKRRVALELVMEDRVGLLLDITNVLTRYGVNITRIEYSKETKGTLIFREFEIEVISYEQLFNVIERLQRIESMKRVRKLA